MNATKHMATMPQRRCHPRALPLLPATAVPPYALPLPPLLLLVPTSSNPVDPRAASPPSALDELTKWAEGGRGSRCGGATRLGLLLLLLLLLV